MGKTFLTVLGALVAGVLWSNISNAEQSQPLPRRARLLLPALCSELPFDQEELISTLRVELLGNGTELRDHGEEVEFGEVVVLAVDTPTCAPAGMLIRVEDPATGRRLERHIDVTDRQRSERARIIALSLAELLVESWSRLVDESPTVGEAIESGESEPDSASEPESPDEVEERDPIDELALRELILEEALLRLEAREEEAQRRVRRTMLTVSMVVRSFPVVQGGQLGGGLGLDLQLSQRFPLQLAFDVGYGYGGGTSELGDIEVHSVVGGLSLLFASRARTARGVIGPRAEIGWAWARGRDRGDVEDVVEGRVDGPTVAVGLTGGGRFRLSDRLWLSVDGQVGWYVVGLEPLVDERSLGGVARALLGLSIGLMIGL